MSNNTFRIPQLSAVRKEENSMWFYQQIVHNVCMHLNLVDDATAANLAVDHIMIEYEFDEPVTTMSHTNYKCCGYILHAYVQCNIISSVYAVKLLRCVEAMYQSNASSYCYSFNEDDELACRDYFFKCWTL